MSALSVGRTSPGGVCYKYTLKFRASYQKELGKKKV